MILGQDILSELKICLDFSDHMIKCNGGAYKGCTTPMKDISKINFAKTANDDKFLQEEIWESEAVLESMEHAHRILDTHYKKADLMQVVRDASHLSSDKQDKKNKGRVEPKDEKDHQDERFGLENPEAVYNKNF